MLLSSAKTLTVSAVRPALGYHLVAFIGKHCPYQKSQGSNSRMFDVVPVHVGSPSRRAIRRRRCWFFEASYNDTYSPDRSLGWETVIAAFGTISPVSPPVLECPERVLCASLFPTMMFHTQTGRTVHRLS